MNLREWALPVYTILMQLATGALFVLWVIRTFSLNRIGDQAMDRIMRRPVLVVFITIIIAIIGSHFHLSNPLQSILAVLNVRHSWLSREIVFTVLLVLTCAALLDQISNPDGKRQRLKTTLGWAAVSFGSAVIYCMSSIYLIPIQAPWNHWTTIAVFFGSSLVLGATSAFALLIMDAVFAEQYEPELANDRLMNLKISSGKLALLVAVALAIILFLNVAQILMIGRDDQLAQTSLSLLLGLYRPLFGVRFAALFAGAGIFILAAFWLLKKGKTPSELVTPVYLACLLALVAEILGRFLFYATHVRVGI